MKLPRNFESAAPNATHFRNVGRDVGSIVAQIACDLTENPNSSTETGQIKFKGEMTNKLGPNIL